MRLKDSGLVRLVVADDHALVRESLLSILRRQSDLEVVGEAADGTTALELIERHQPDVAIVDQSMPMLVGVDVIKSASQLGIATRFVLLTMHSEPFLAQQALHAGAHAVVLKDDAVSVLLEAVSQIRSGHRYVSPSLTLDPHQGVEPLTDREREVLVWISRGLSNGEIADELGISPRTVDTHRTRIMRKLGRRSVADLVSFAVRSGLVQS